MKGRSKDSTRTLATRILAAHRVEPPRKSPLDGSGAAGSGAAGSGAAGSGAAGSAGSGEGTAGTFRVDQLVLARAPREALAGAQAAGVRESAVEISIAYPPQCISWGGATHPGELEPAGDGAGRSSPTGFLVAQPGAGYAPHVHLERFAAPGRLAVVDDPRLAVLGAMGMLTLVAQDDSLASVLNSGTIDVAEPVSVLVALTGRLRPFVNVRDAGLWLLKSDARAVIQDVARRTGAPVVLEFGGPSTKQLSVPDRAALASFAPRLGASGVLFPADDKTETFLRDQRRSKAFRSVASESAGYEAVLTLDLTTVDPLLLDASGEVLPVRLLEGKPVSQVILGGDSGTTLRDLYTVGSLLKGKRPPGNVEFLFAPPSRQALEVLARDGVLLDLIAMGARIVEPDRRVLTGEYYPPMGRELSLVTFDPTDPPTPNQRVTVSAETLAFAIAHGQLGDPRGFRRQVRVALPRQLPTEDALLLGGSRRDGSPRRPRPTDADTDADA